MSEAGVRTLLFLLSDVVLVALLILMARIYFYGLRLSNAILAFIMVLAGAGFIVFAAGIAVDGFYVWGGPLFLSAVLFMSALMAPSAPAAKALVPERPEPPAALERLWQVEDEIPSAQQMSVIEPPSLPPLDYRHFVIERETNMLLHRPNGSLEVPSCYVSELGYPGRSKLTLDDLVNRAENHECWATPSAAETNLLPAVAP